MIISFKVRVRAISDYVRENRISSNAKKGEAPVWLVGFEVNAFNF